MNAIDIILNLAALLLWLNWRSVKLDPLASVTPATLVGTLKRTEPQRFKAVRFLAAVIVLLMFRGFIYWQVGSPAEWTPKMDLTVVVLAFRIDALGPAMLFSFLSFLEVLVIFYCWLLVLAAINQNTTQPDPILKLIRLQLGWLARWPWYVQLPIPLLLVTVLWAALHPLMVQASVLGPVTSWRPIVAQGAVVGLVLYASLKYLLPLLLLLHLVLSYVYLGRNALWDFVNNTARHLLWPFRRLPLQLGRLDFGPLIAALLILGLFEALPNYILHRFLEMKRSVWPQ